MSVRCLLTAWLAGLVILNAAPAGTAGAHIHGQGSLDVSVEGDRVELLLIAPLDDLQLDPEGGPEELIQRGSLFSFDGAICALDSSRLESAAAYADMWSEPEHDKHQTDHDTEADHGHEEDAHSDSYLSWTYVCSATPDRLRVMLFTETHLERLAVQAVGPSGVRSGTLTAGSNDFELP